MFLSFLKRYGLAAKQYKWYGLTTLLGVIGVSAIIALQPSPSPQYKSAGKLSLNSSLAAVSETNEQLQKQGERILSEKFLLADEVLESVVQTLRSQGMQLEVAMIRRHTKVQVDDRSKQTQLVAVEFWWPAPDEAQAVLETLLQTIVDYSLAANQAQLEAIINALDQQLPQVEDELQAAEKVLRDYDRQEGHAIQAAKDGSLLEAIAAAEQQYRQNEIALAGLDAQIESLEQQLGLSSFEALTSTALSADPIIAQLRSQILETETQLELLSADLREVHPEIKKLHSNLAAYNGLLEARAAEVIGGAGLKALPSVDQVRYKSTLDPARAALANQLVTLDIERKALINQQQVLLQTDNRLKKEYENFPEKQLERDQKAQAVALKRALYEQFQAKRIDAEAARAETISSLMIAEPVATILQSQLTLKPLSVMAIGSLLGIALSGGIILLLYTLDGVVRDPESLKSLLRANNIRTLEEIPHLNQLHGSNFSAILSLESSTLEEYERLRSKIKYIETNAAEPLHPKVIVITSGSSGEGKTTTAVNLAIASARANQRTLFFEGDLHQPSYCNVIDPEYSGKIDTDPMQYYSGQSTSSMQAVSNINNLYVTPSLGSEVNASAILESSAIEEFMKTARSRFDWIIIDAPFNNALKLGQWADGIVFVSRPGYTKKSLLETRLEDLSHNIIINLLGVVINDTETTE